MRELKLYFDDLNEEAQKKVLETFGSNLNLDVIPLVTLVEEGEELPMKLVEDFLDKIEPYASEVTCSIIDTSNGHKCADYHHVMKLRRHSRRTSMSRWYKLLLMEAYNITLKMGLLVSGDSPYPMDNGVETIANWPMFQSIVIDDTSITVTVHDRIQIEYKVILNSQGGSSHG